MATPTVQGPTYSSNPAATSAPPGAAPPTGPYPGWAPGQVPVPPRPVTLPRGIDLSVIVIGIGALLTFVGFLCGAAAAGQIRVSVSAYQSWLEGFFVITGVGLLLMAGGWLYRTVLQARSRWA